jgi:transposase
MANQIKMAVSEAIIRLLERGWSQRRVARELGVNRETVSRYVRLAAESASKPATVPAGTDGPNPATLPTGTEGAGEAKPAILPAGKYSTCRPHHAAILAGVEAGLTAQRLFQDLRTDHGFDGGYDAVKRYVRRLAAKHPHAVARMECAPGEEAQVDFGLGAPVLVDGHKRRSWVFRIVLSHSRKGYSEAVFRQTTESFIRCLENAFRYFGGVPKTLVIDNLRAAVAQADWYEPELIPKVAEFCRHHSTVILPTRPRRPEHKGKVERGVGYVKGSALKGRVFASLAEENAHLLWWETHVADQRIHGTTRQHVGRRFEQERPALLPLTPMPFPCFEEGPRTVHRDAHVEVKHAYYPVPEEYIGRQVWARYDGKMVRLYNLRMDLLATYTRQPPGTFAPVAPGVATRRSAQTAEELCRRAEQVGPACGEWAQRVRIERGVEAIRVLLGFLKLSRRVGKPMLEAVCTQATANNAWRLRDLRRYLEGRPAPQQLNFMEQHPLIRDLGEYGALVDGTQGEAVGQ